jgi:ABC-type sugar transport system ATPase subunit
LLDVQNLSVRAGAFTLSALNLHVDDGICCILLGKSGTGKTVFLETLSGRYPVLSGHIFRDDTDITNLPPEKRKIALVYQNYALFPHLTVAQNIAFPLKVAGKPACICRERTAMLMDKFSLTPLSDMYPETLSGGERQRTALARALAAEPKLLLLDEPMAALDCVTKENVKKTLQDMRKTCNMTIVQVTHDPDEARCFADRFAVMQNGTLSQVWTREKMLSLRKEDIYALLDT